MKINTTKILTILAERGLTKSALAERSGVSRQNISTILNRGTCEPVTAGRIANGLGVSVIELAITDETLMRFIKRQPTVDAMEVEHGEWEYGKWDQGHWVQGNERCRCSVCHRDFAVDNANIWHGCPHCLAKMDGGNADGQRINL